MRKAMSTKNKKTQLMFQLLTVIVSSCFNAQVSDDVANTFCSARFCCVVGFFFAWFFFPVSVDADGVEDGGPLILSLCVLLFVFFFVPCQNLEMRFRRYSMARNT